MMTVCQNIILRIEKRLIIERTSYLRSIMILRRFFFDTFYRLSFSMYSNFTLHFDIFGVPNQRVLIQFKRHLEQRRVLEWQNIQLLMFWSFTISDVAQSCRIIPWFSPAFAVRLEMERSQWQLIVYNGYELFSIEKSQITNIISIIQTNPIIMCIHTT